MRCNQCTARLKASEVGRLRSVQTCGVYHVGDASHVKEECHHSRLREQMSQVPLAEDGQQVKTDPDDYSHHHHHNVCLTKVVKRNHHNQY